MWEVIIHGARGLWFFPEQIAPSFEWDTTPPDVAAELTRQNALITSLASVLQGPIDPPDIGASAATPIELGWRSDASGRYIFALNLSPVAHANRAITLTGIDASSASVFGESRSVPIVAGVLSDDFAPYAVHIYVVAAGDLIFANGFDQ